MSVPDISASVEGVVNYVNRWICRFSQYEKGQREVVSDSFSDSNIAEWFARVVGDPESVERFVTQPTPIICDVQLTTPEERSAFEEQLKGVEASMAQTPSPTPAMAPSNAEVSLFVEINLSQWKEPGDYQIQFTIDPTVAQGLTDQYLIIVGGDGMASISCRCSRGAVSMSMLGQSQSIAVAASGMISTAAFDTSTSLTVTGNGANGSDYTLAGDARVRIV